MADKFAFVSAFEKDGLEELAPAIYEAGHEIISLGRTAEIISGLGIPVIDSEEFVGSEVDQDQLIGLSVRERRERVGMHLAQHMCLSRKELDSTNCIGIDLVYVNLMPNRDKTGELMISAALEGDRTILTDPEQIPSFVQFLETSPYEWENTEDHHLLLALEAKIYRANYALQAAGLDRISAAALRI